MPTPGEIVKALADMELGEFRATIARARPPEDYDSGARRAAAADAVRTLMRRGSTTIADVLDHDDPAERRAAARRILHADNDTEQAATKAAAVAQLADYQRSSMGRGNRITPGNAPSDRANAVAELSQHMHVDPSTDNSF